MRGRKPINLPRVIEALTAPMTQAQLCLKLGVAQSIVSRALSAMMDASPRQAHISGWKRAKSSGGPPVAIYSPGPGKDAHCHIRPLTDAERTRRMRRNRNKRDLLTRYFYRHIGG